MIVSLTPLCAARQEVSYFDTEASSGRVMSALAEDCAAVQTAMSEKARLLLLLLMLLGGVPGARHLFCRCPPGQP